MNNIDELPPDQQLDFWLGEWDVFWGEGERGSNLVTKVLEGKVIQEDFDGAPSMAFRGRSLSAYSPRHETWRQTWVDTDGNYWHFRGGWQGDRFVFSTDDIDAGRPIKLRMVFHRITDDTLQWDWERSEDGGETWGLRWALDYRRRPAPAA